MKIRSQALLLSVIPLAFLLALLIVASLLQRQIEQTTAWSRRSADALGASARIAAGFDEINRGLLAYSRRVTPAAVDAFRRGRQTALRGASDVTVAADPQPAQRALAASYAARTAALVKIVDAYFSYTRDGRKKQAAQLVASAATRQAAAGWQKTRAAFDEGERVLTIRRFDALRRAVAALGATMLGLAIAGVVLTLLVTGRFGWRTAARLERLAENAQRLGAGESPPIIGGVDEIAQLDRVYHTMTQRIQETLREREEALHAYEREHDVASTLQRALLPQELPRIDGLRIDTAYLPAAQGTEIGGDWYDVFAISERVVGISVGDVAGHGLRAAAIMGNVRQSIRTAARDADEPSTILRRVNGVLCADESNAVVTAFFALLDLHDGTLRYAMAGHPPPMVLRQAGSAEQLQGEGFVLGVDARASFSDYSCTLHVGSGLLLYTDGIVEVERDYFKGLDDLRAAAVAEYLDPSPNIAEGIHQRIFSRSTARDDSAILFVGVTSLGARSGRAHEHKWTLDARDRRSVYRVKRALLWQLGGFAPVAAELAAVEVIVGELLSNVARHTPGPANVIVHNDDGTIVLHVEDAGPSFAMNGHLVPDVRAESGRGMFLVRSLARDVEVTRTAGGNRVSVVLPMNVS